MAKRDRGAASGGIETDVDEGEGVAAGTKKFSRRFGLRALLGVPAALIGFDAFAQRADAATTTPWVLGGNSIATTGTDYLGTTNVAPIILKTKATSAASVTEKARLTPVGFFGVGTTNPSAKIHAVGNTVAITGETPSTAAGAAGVQGRVTAASPASGAAGVSGVAANTGSAGIGVKGTHGGSGSGVSGLALGLGTGVTGNGGNTGVSGSGKNYGGIFQSSADGGYGVYGTGNSTGVFGVGTYYGVQGSADTGVYAAGVSYGLYGVTSGNGPGVEGHSSYRGTTGYGDNAGVYGSSGYVGAWGEGTSYGVYGHALGTTGVTTGVYGQSDSPAGFAGYFQGNVSVNGTLSKSAGSFKIDHPLDPDNKYLSHSFVESPDMMNVYNGNAVLGADGTAAIELPSYFDVLNRDMRYQLTAIGAPAQLYVKEKVKGNRFVIAGDRPGTEVSWQVTGIRQDEYAREHPIVVEEDKAAHDRGRRLHPGPNGRAINVGPDRHHTVAGAETAAAVVPPPRPPAPPLEATPES